MDFFSEEFLEKLSDIPFKYQGLAGWNWTRCFSGQVEQNELSVALMVSSFEIHWLIQEILISSFSSTFLFDVIFTRVIVAETEDAEPLIKEKPQKNDTGTNYELVTQARLLWNVNLY